jgi:peroxiredoxin
MRAFQFGKAGELLRGAAIALLMVVAVAVTAPSEAAEPESAKDRTKEIEADRALDALIDSANERIGAAGGLTDDLKRALKRELGEFAAAHPQTEAAVIATINEGTMAAMLDEYAEAEATFRRAAEMTDDPAAHAEIQMHLSMLQIRPGETLPAFSLKTVDGRTVTTKDFAGQHLLLDFWATWCAPCIEELPNLKRVYETYHPQGLEVLGISLDSDREYFGRFIEEQSMDWVHAYNADQPEDQNLPARYGVMGIPRMILVGPDGRVVHANLRGDALEAVIRDSIAKAE